MFAKIKLGLENNKNTIKIIKFTLLSVLLLIVTWLLDYEFVDAKKLIPSFFLLTQEVSSSFLLNLSGVFLTVTTFSLTTIITVLNKYSDSFTPRIVQDFIEKPNVLSLFGVFIGGFFYTVLALFMQQNIEPDEKVISGTIGIFYAIISMIAFVMFTRRILIDIKVSNVIEDLYSKCLCLVEKEAEMRKNAERVEFDQEVADDSDRKIKIYAKETGYFYEVDDKKLMEVLKDIKCEILIFKKLGEHVARGVYMADLTLGKDVDYDKDKLNKLLDDISSCFVINFAKNEKIDYHHETTNLVEVAMTALSPGINDPNTAMACINKLALLLGKLFSSKNYFIVLASNEKAKVIYETYSVEEELYLSFSQIIHYSMGEPMLAKALLDGFYLIYMLADDSANDAIKAFMREFYELASQALESEVDKQIIENIMEDFEKNADSKSDKSVVRDGE